MKKRYAYLCLFGIPGLFIAALATLFLFGVAAGALWLFVFGDDPWPAATDTLLPALLVLTFLILWAGIIAAGFAYGKRREDGRPVPRRHLLLAAAATLMPILLMVLHQFSVGNFGPKSASLLCGDFCRERGYAGSGIPPRDSGDRSCLCYDAAGREALRVSLDTLAARR